MRLLVLYIKWGKMTKPSPEDLELEEIRGEIPMRHKLLKIPRETKAAAFLILEICLFLDLHSKNT